MASTASASKPAQTVRLSVTLNRRFRASQTCRGKNVIDVIVSDRAPTRRLSCGPASQVVPAKSSSCLSSRLLFPFYAASHHKPPESMKTNSPVGTSP